MVVIHDTGGVPHLVQKIWGKNIELAHNRKIMQIREENEGGLWKRIISFPAPPPKRANSQTTRS